MAQDSILGGEAARVRIVGPSEDAVQARVRFPPMARGLEPRIAFERSLYTIDDIVHMTQTVSVRLSKESLREVDRLAERLKTDRSEALRRFIERGLREARIDEALDLLRKGKISLGRAAEVAGVTLYEMLDLVRRHHIPSGYGPEDLARDLRELGRRG